MIDTSTLPTNVRVALLTTDVKKHRPYVIGGGEGVASHVRLSELSDPVDAGLEDTYGSRIVVEIVAIQV